MLKSTIQKTIPTIDGDVDSHIYAKLIAPRVDNLKKTISFRSSYYARYQKEITAAKEAVIVDGMEIEMAEDAAYGEIELLLYSSESVYQEQEIEELYARIKPLLPEATTYFEGINDPIQFAFVYTVKTGNYYGMEAGQWEEVIGD